MTDRYILKDGIPIPEPDIRKWEEGLGTEERKVAKTTVDGIVISTVFLGIDHGFGKPLPLLFETMIFEGPHDLKCWRYSTLVEAKAGHERVVKALRNGTEP